MQRGFDESSRSSSSDEYEHEQQHEPKQEELIEIPEEIALPGAILPLVELPKVEEPVIPLIVQPLVHQTQLVTIPTPQPLPVMQQNTLSPGQERAYRNTHGHVNSHKVEFVVKHPKHIGKAIKKWRW